MKYFPNQLSRPAYPDGDVADLLEDRIRAQVAKP